LSACKITDEGVKAFTAAADKLKNLKNIRFSMNKITDEGLKAVAAVATNFTYL
jgi:hypothetical protein